MDEAVARLRKGLPARLQRMAQQKQTRELKTVQEVLIRPCIVAASALAQEWRQTQQAVLPGFAGRA